MEELLLPPALEKGDTIMIVSPSGKIDKKFLEGAEKRLKEWGFKVVKGKYAGSSSGRFAGTVKNRVSDLQKALDSPKVKAIFCSRGGYGAIHLIDKLKLTGFKENPKWLIGYSDITLLHALVQQSGYVSLHAPMARHLSVEPPEDPCAEMLLKVLEGELPTYEFDGHKLNRPGSCEGILRGGNLSVLYGLRGTPYDVNKENTILFIEDIGESPYHIDRMMNNFRLGGIIENLSGLIVGQFTEYEEDKSLGKEVYELIKEMVKPYDFPVCFDFPVGHTSRNYPLLCGSKVQLEVTKKKVKLESLFSGNVES